MLLPINQALVNEDVKRQMFVGIVEDRDDPEKIGRLKIRIPAIHGQEIETADLPWAIPFRSVLFGSSEGTGFFSVPYLGSKVVVTFHRGDSYSPMYLAQTVSPNEILAELLENYGNRYGFSDAAGNKFFIDEEQGIALFTHKSGTSLQIADDGSVTVSVAKDETKNVAGRSQVTIEDASTVLVKGQSSFTCNENVSIHAKKDVDAQIDGHLTCDVTGQLNATSQSANIQVGGTVDLSCASAAVVVDGDASIDCANASLTCQTKASVVAPQVELQSTTVKVTASGSMDLVANTVTIKSAVVNLGEGATEPLILGNSFATWLQSTLMVWANAHTHVSSAPGAPTSPPILPLTPGAALPNGAIYSKFIRGK